MLQLIVLFLLLLCSHAQQPVVLHGGSYQLLPNSRCFIPNRFTAACTCPPSYDAFCYDALIYNQTTVDVSNTVTSSTKTIINSNFCICGRKSGLSEAAVWGGAYQQDDSSDCRFNNPYTSSCSCTSNFQPTPLRSLVFKLGSNSGEVIGSHIYMCLRSQSANPVGAIATDTTAFSLNSQSITLQVLNNFHGLYTISSDQTSLKCLQNNPLPALRSSRYLSSINAAQCTCPDNSCAASFFWISDAITNPDFTYQRVGICESSMELPVSSSTMKNKVMLGYQKWQATPKNGFGLGYQHWTRDGVSPADSTFVDHAVFDVWPDTSEFPQNNLTATSLPRPDGSATTLYDSFLPESMDLHIHWLQYYGLDGVWLQRFLVDNTPAFLFSVSKVRDICEKYGRVFGVEWDISGTTDTNLYTILQTDASSLLNQQPGLFGSSAYVHHEGKPLVTVWGFGIRSDVNVTTATRCIQMLRDLGFAVMGGVEFNWRTQLGANGQNFSSVYDMMDIITPWAVGVYNNPQNYLSFAPTIQNADASYCNQAGKGYTPTVFPGFSWINLQTGNGNPATLNQIPRLGGVLWQTQVDSLESSVVGQPSFSHMFLAMYDEFDEGTAIGKAAESSLDRPAKGSFLSLDADGFHVPNDHYLCLASRETYRRHQPLAITFPYSFRSSS